MKYRLLKTKEPREHSFIVCTEPTVAVYLTLQVLIERLYPDVWEDVPIVNEKDKS